MIRVKEFCLALVLCGGVGSLWAEVATVADKEAAGWLDSLIPLPHEISIRQKVSLRPEVLAIRVRANASEVEKQALADLLTLIREKTGASPTGSEFEALIGVADEQGRLEGAAVEGFERLKTLPNKEQSYVIVPQGEKRLIVAGLGPPGVYYGAQTLCQLLERTLTKERVVVPLARVTDWPDLEERGLWNNDLDMIPWLASLKLNFTLLHTSPGVIKRDQPIRAQFPKGKQIPNVLEAARLRAMHPAVTVRHLNYIGHHDKAYEAYPELAGKGDKAIPIPWHPTRNIRLPCATNPVLRKLIADYMTSLAQQGASEVTVWLSEHQAQCECEPCLKVGQFRAETEAAYGAWTDVRRQHPQLMLRIFYCLGGLTSEDTYQCLKALPPEVRIERCYGTFKDAFDKCAREGRWVGSYAGPPLSSGQESGMRFYGSAWTKDFVQSLLKGQWRALYSINYVYSTGAWQRELYGFHISALAEWAWNVNGRTGRDFARAWATRQGCAQPEKVAEWVDLIEPVERANVNVVSSAAWAKLPELVRQRQSVRLGEGVFVGFRAEKDFDQSLRVAEQALQVAQGLQSQEFVLESRYVLAFVRALQQAHRLLDAAKPEAPQALDGFGQAVGDMERALNEMTDLTKSEPRAFADTVKQQHSQLWQQRLTDIGAALRP